MYKKEAPKKGSISQDFCVAHLYLSIQFFFGQNSVIWVHHMSPKKKEENKKEEKYLKFFLNFDKF